MKKKYTYHRILGCDPKKVCEELNRYDEMGYDVLSVHIVANGTEYLIYLIDRNV